jgi:inositol 3-alpha-galactosyltransferase
MQREDIKMLVKKWWDIYDDESLDYNNTVASAGAGQRSLRSFLAALAEACGVPYITAPSAA